jgi:hypothetical protein
MAVTRRRLSSTHAALEHERALAIDALRLGRLLRDSSLWPSRWTEPGFGAEVERCRRHVADLKTQDALASAYAYDVFERLTGGRGDTEGSPIRVAYALRWLELQEDSIGPAWPAMVR